MGGASNILKQSELPLIVSHPFLINLGLGLLECIRQSTLKRTAVIYCEGASLEKTVSGDLIGDFESLVDELMKKEPNENQIKFLMEKLELQYDSDPVNRISFVLEKMNKLVFETNKKKVDHDL